MSAAPATAPATPARRVSLPRWIAGGTLTAALLTTLTIAVWPASEADKARSDGEAFGASVAQLESATTTAEVDDALIAMQDAVSDTRAHAGDAVAEQADDQAYALDRAVDGFVGSHTSDDSFEVDLYQAELDTALDDLSSQAEDFRTTGPEVQQAFWDGVQTGYSGE
jgi:hypothetical protein